MTEQRTSKRDFAELLAYLRAESSQYPKNILQIKGSEAAALVDEIERLRTENARLREALGRILENEASDWKFAEEFGGYVLDDELREEARAVLRREGWK